MRQPLRYTKRNLQRALLVAAEHLPSNHPVASELRQAMCKQQALGEPKPISASIKPTMKVLSLGSSGSPTGLWKSRT
ncbi:MAG: hypothetical protein HZC55_20095 [Verrucomicrobia bacterium]|nr:hypothetical protein [Verrucomicrobiota bacterium]